MVAKLVRPNSLSVKAAYDLTGKVIVITGGAGLLGAKHAEALAEMGGTPVLIDIDGERVRQCAEEIRKNFGGDALGLTADVTNGGSIAAALETTLTALGRVDGLINNAANNPKVEAADTSGMHWSRFENFSLEAWRQDFDVGLTGAFLCSQIIGGELARRGAGVILNIASDLALIAPDQRLYRRRGLPEDQQPVKPVSYSVIKSGLLGLTRYLATYWAHRRVRVNALAPGGVYADQEADFVQRLTSLIPLGRMADEDEYKAAVIFLVSEASSYMTGAVLTIDGGRTCW